MENFRMNSPPYGQGGWCHPPFTPPPPPRPPPPGAQGAYGPHHRHTNNVWCDPGLYQPYPQPPRMSHPGVRPPHHTHPPPGFHMGGPTGCGGGRGGRGFGRGQGGGRGGGRGGHHPQHGGQNSNHGNSFNNKGMKGSQKPQKGKVDKRDLPENNAFHCEVCDRGFKTEEKFQEHVNEHEHCRVEGCRYVAAPKLVQLHYNTQHRTGLAKKIWSLESPQDIEKWIQERKRNFPTKENIARKAQETADRRGRGEMIETKQYGKMRGRGRRGQFGQHDHRQNNQQQRPDSQRSSGCEVSSQPTQSSASQDSRPGQKRPSPEEENHGKDGSSDVTDAQASDAKKIKLESEPCTNRSAGTSDKSGNSVDPLSLLIEDNNSSHESDEDEDGDAKPEMLHGQGLASLIASYESDSNEEAEGAKGKEPTGTAAATSVASPSAANQPQGSRSAPGPQNSQSQQRDSRLKSDSSQCQGHDSAPSPHTSQSEPRGSTQAPHGSQSRGRDSAARPHSPTNQSQPRRSAPRPQSKQTQPSAKFSNKGPSQLGRKKGRKPTLLEMLLANEIRHERNVLLQCVHYIVKNKFLGVCNGQSSTIGK